MPVTKSDDLPKCVETGQTLVTRLLDRFFSHPKVVEKHPHWGEFREPCHLEKLDAGCAEAVGLNAELVEHLGHHWPPSGINLAHQAIVNAIEDGVPVRFSWKPARGSETSISASDNGIELVVRIFSPAVRVAPKVATREPVPA